MKNSKRESIALFFIDLYGTIDGKFSDYDLQVFAKLLKRLKEKNKSNYLFFDLLSTESPDIVNYYELALSKYFSDGLRVMEKLPNEEVTKETKITYALCYIEFLKKQFDIVAVYCADDSVMVQEMFSNALLYKEGIELHSIIPKDGDNNLNFINNEIEKCFIGQNSKYLSNYRC